jgi:hypothetical protein
MHNDLLLCFSTKSIEKADQLAHLMTEEDCGIEWNTYYSHENKAFDNKCLYTQSNTAMIWKIVPLHEKICSEKDKKTPIEELSMVGMPKYIKAMYDMGNDKSSLDKED